MNEDELGKWLARANERYRAADMPPVGRPFKALAELSIELQTAIDLTSLLSKRVFKWFEDHTQPGSHLIGPLFTGAYFFDACFWPLDIPFAIGTFNLNLLDCLKTMPDTLKAQLLSDPQECPALRTHGANCIDFALGMQRLNRLPSLLPRGKSLLENGGREIRTVVAQLLSSPINPKAALSARMATEIYLKALLVIRGNTSERNLKCINHDISSAMDQCIDLTSAQELIALRSRVGIFPDIAERYSGQALPPRKTWEAYELAQATASAVVRVLIGQNSGP